MDFCARCGGFDRMRFLMVLTLNNESGSLKEQISVCVLLLILAYSAVSSTSVASALSASTYGGLSLKKLPGLSLSQLVAVELMCRNCKCSGIVSTPMHKNDIYF